MAKILAENGATEITPETAMRWFCWYEIVEQMEKQDGESLDKAIERVARNCADWEMQVLKKYLELTEKDLTI